MYNRTVVWNKSSLLLKIILTNTNRSTIYKDNLIRNYLQKLFKILSSNDWAEEPNLVIKRGGAQE